MLNHLMTGLSAGLFALGSKIKPSDQNPQFADFVALQLFVSPTIIRSKNGALCGGFELGGMYTELESDKIIIDNFEALARVLSSVSQDYEIGLQMIRRQCAVPHPKIHPGCTPMIRNLLKEHVSTFSSGRDNRFFVWLESKPAAAIGPVVALRNFNLLLGNLQNALKPFRAVPLEAPVMRGIWRSLANGCAIRPLRQGNSRYEGDAIADGKIRFHPEVVCSLIGQVYGGQRACALAELKEIPYDHGSLAIDATALLKQLPLDVDLTIKFKRRGKAAEVDALDKEANRKRGVKQDAVAQEFDEVKGAIQRDELSVGSVVTSLVVWAGDRLEAASLRAEVVGELYAQQGIKFVSGRHIGLDTFFWRFPFACEKMARPRNGMIGSEAIAKLMTFGSFYKGKEDGNKFGGPCLVMPGRSGHPVFMAPDQEPGRQTGEFPPQNTVIFGNVGSGKSTTFNLLIASMLGQRGQLGGMVIDRDEGNKYAVLAAGGSYIKVEMDKPTGWNPLGLEYRRGQGASGKRVVEKLLAMLCEAYTQDQRFDVSRAVESAFRQPAGNRWLGTVLDFLQEDTNRESLQRWVNGPLAWVFSGKGTTPLDDALVGVDISAILKDDEISGPVLLYLMHRVERLNLTDAAVLYVAELSGIVKNPLLTEFLSVGLATWRKSGLITMLDTQTPSQVLGTALAGAIRDQCRIKIVFPSESMDLKGFEDLGIPADQIANLVQLAGPRQFGWFTPLGSAIVNGDLNRLGRRYLLLLTGSKKHVEALVRVDQLHSGLSADDRLDAALDLLES